MKKLTSILATLILLLIVLNPNSANAAYFCTSGSSVCEDVFISKGVTYVASPSIYLTKGKLAIVEFETEITSVHHVAFAAYSSSTGAKVSNWGYAGYQGGEDFEYFTAPSSGYYYLFAACQGGDGNTCVGGGTIRVP